ncbi:hypothetical protein [Parasphingorhabdus pacifica]
MAGIDVPPELLERMRGILDGGAHGLEDIANSQPPGIDAGESTSTVAETLGLLMQSSAGALAGVQQMTNDVQVTRETYLNNDEAAANLFGRHEQ